MANLIQQGVRYVLRVLFTRVVGKLVALPVRRRLNAFELATHDPQRVQDALLRDILSHHASTAFGRDHGFAAIQTLADFRRQLPVAGYDYFDPYISRVRRGETNALLADPVVHMFALTSGTTATRKFIPVTDRYLEDYKRGWNIWGLKVFRDHPEVKLRPILQMSGDHEEMHTETGIPCGAVSGLTATMQKKIVRWLYCAPAAVGRIKDATSKYYTALRLSVPRQVAMIISANPSTLINLARTGDQFKEDLIRDVRDGTLSHRFDVPDVIRAALARRLKKHPERARELEAIASRIGTLYPKDIWPRDCLLGNWTGGSMGAYLRHYPRYFGTHPVRDIGLLASEGRMTLPFADGTTAGILDITSHYFEFIPEDEINSPQPTVLSAHELQDGGRYFILPTTGFGLYRYNIFDLVRVAGFHNKTPKIEFLSKGAYISSITGEKLSEYQVTQSMVEVLHQLDLSLSTYSLAPCWDDEQPYYGLFLERGDLPAGVGEQLAIKLDEALCRSNVEYASKRESLRLGTARVEWVRPGFWAKWDRDRLGRSGGTLEQYKHPCLISDLQFRDQVGRELQPSA
jgi:GH3 auxin-responsive promoter